MMIKRIFAKRVSLAQLFFPFVCALVEFFFHLFIFGASDGIAFAMLLGALWGCLFSLIYSLLPEKASLPVAGTLLLLFCLFSCVQLIYFEVFGNLMQLSLVQMGGNVLATYGGVIVTTVLRNFFKVLVLLLLPAAAVVLLPHFLPKLKERKLPSLATLLSALLVLFLLCGLTAKQGKLSPLRVYQSDVVSTEFSYQRLGLAGGAAKDLFRRGGGVSSEFSAGIEAAVPGEDYSRATHQMQSIDFDTLAASTDDTALQSLDAYFSSVAPTGKNNMTGLLAGYNLITVCAESYCPYLVSEELTPTLYRLSHNGILFENYFGTYQSLTSNGEYTLCTGLYPNMHNNSGATSFEDSMTKYLPFCLGNALKAEGYQTFAYHNNVGEFYSRNLTHPNMGYTFRSAGDGLDIHLTNPSSDEELFRESLKDFVNSSTPFHAYYMSWSGHNPYNWTNAMSAKNRDAVAELPYSEGVKAYLACNLELEYGLKALTEALADAGLAERTVIVLTNDHFPYGLTMAQYDELAGFPVGETFEKYRNSFLCYVPELEENITVDEYCCTADILPTLLNLFGVSYDSRLLAGRDVFSDAPHVAVLMDQSFITDTMYFDASEGLAADDTVKDAHGYTAADYQRYVENLFALSAAILDSDYYAHAYCVERGDDEPSVVSYEDIQNVFHKSAVQYVTVNHLMDADSETLFGGEREAFPAELMDVLRRIAGDTSGEEDAVAWAVGQGIIKSEDEFPADAPLTHPSCAVLMMRFAALHGGDMSFDDSKAGQYAPLGKDAANACLWATEKTVFNKTMDAVYEIKDAPLTRFQLAAYSSYLCTRILGL